MNLLKRVLLHIGPPKTGTTSIQNFVWTNRYALMKQGIYVPLVGARKTQPNHLAALLADSGREGRAARLNSRANTEGGDAEQRKLKFQHDLGHELSTAPMWHTLLFSSEAIFPSNLIEIAYYREIFANFASQFESLMYLRRQDRWLSSRTLQNRRGGRRAGLALNGGMPKRFSATVRTWHSQSDRCHIRRFDPNYWVNGGLLDDFCAAIGADAVGLDLTDIRKNPALFQEQLELVDAMNPRLVDTIFKERVLRRSRFLELTAETLGGTKIDFPRTSAKATFESFALINRWLHDTIDPDGPPLFFDDDFSGYEDTPTNERLYSLAELGRLLSTISPMVPPETDRGRLVEQIVTAYLSRDKG